MMFWTISKQQNLGRIIEEGEASHDVPDGGEQV
jgi:hypothetical protein